jgi:NAD(P)H dehydrogenase (quinone)
LGYLVKSKNKYGGVDMGFINKFFGKSSNKVTITMSKIKLAVIYYSTGGTNYQLAQWAAEAGREAGAEVKILKVQEFAPTSVIEGNPAWKALVEATKDVPVATPGDIVGGCDHFQYTYPFW